MSVAPYTEIVKPDVSAPNAPEFDKLATELQQVGRPGSLLTWIQACDIVLTIDADMGESYDFRLGGGKWTAEADLDVSPGEFPWINPAQRPLPPDSLVFAVICRCELTEGRVPSRWIQEDAAHRALAPNRPL